MEGDVRRSAADGTVMHAWQKAALAGGSAIAIATPMVYFFEGDRPDAYRDIAGVWTVCVGHTATAAPGQRKTPAECTALLRRDLAEHDRGLVACVGREMPPQVHAAMLSLAFNVGVRALCHSGTAALLRDGRWAEACNRIPLWNKVGGRSCADPANNCAGIVRRREEERALCLGVTG